MVKYFETIFAKWDCYLNILSSKYDKEFKKVFYMNIYLYVVLTIIAKISYIRFNFYIAEMIDGYCLLIYILFIYYIGIIQFINILKNRIRGLRNE